MIQNLEFELRIKSSLNKSLNSLGLKKNQLINAKEKYKKLISKRDPYNKLGLMKSQKEKLASCIGLPVDKIDSFLFLMSKSLKTKKEAYKFSSIDTYGL